MIVLCQNQEQTINLSNFNSLYIEKQYDKYFLKVDINNKTYLLGVYYSSEKVDTIYNEILDNLIIGERSLLYKMPEDAYKTLPSNGKSTLVDLKKITLEEITKNNGK